MVARLISNNKTNLMIVHQHAFTQYIQSNFFGVEVVVAGNLAILYNDCNRT